MTQEQILQEFETLTRKEQEAVAQAIYSRLDAADNSSNQATVTSRRVAAIERLQGALK